jgi:hypothetical protein
LTCRSNNSVGGGGLNTLEAGRRCCRREGEPSQELEIKAKVKITQNWIIGKKHQELMDLHVFGRHYYSDLNIL